MAAGFAGACLGFLWWNAAPARIFMGDVGALGIGSALAFLALTLNTHLLLILICGINVMEAGSVAVQMGVFKASGRKRRLFRMSPIHHHFELGGWPETTVIIRFWLISAICVAARARHLHRRLHPGRGDRHCARARLRLGDHRRVDRARTAAPRLRRRSSPTTTSTTTSEMLAAAAGRRAAAGSVDVDARRRSPDSYDLVSPAPGVPETHPVIVAALAAGVAVVSEIELAYRWEQERPGGPRPMLAITGTDGKTTTTEMTVAMLRAGRRAHRGAGQHRHAAASTPST